MLLFDRECGTEYHNGRRHPVTSCLPSEQTEPEDATKSCRYRHIPTRRTVSTDVNGMLLDER